MIGSCNGVKKKIKFNDYIKNLKEFLLEDRWELVLFECFVFGMWVKMYKLWYVFILFLFVSCYLLLDIYVRGIYVK